MEYTKKKIVELIDGLNEDIKILIENSDIPEQFLLFKWKDYSPEEMIKGEKIVDEEIKKSRLSAKNKCIEYDKKIQKIYETKSGLSLIIKGASGSGKSALGVLLLKSVILRLKQQAYYTSFSDFSMESITLSFKEHQSAFEEKFIEPEWLMIDELETIYSKKGNNFNDKNLQKIQDCLYFVLSKRYLLKKPTIITTNILSESDLEDTVGTLAYNLFKKRTAYLPPINIKGSKISVEEDVYDIPNGTYSISKINDMIKDLVMFYNKQIEDYEKNLNNKKQSITPKYKEIKTLKKDDIIAVLKGSINRK